MKADLLDPKIESLIIGSGSLGEPAHIILLLNYVSS